MEKSVQQAIQSKPTTMSELAKEMGDSWSTRREIIQSYTNNGIMIEPIESTNLLLFSLIIIVVIELLPESIRSLPALLALFVFPFIWTKELIQYLKLDANLVIPLIVLELTVIGLILGYSGFLTPIAISVSLFLTIMVKWLFLVYLRNS